MPARRTGTRGSGSDAQDVGGGNTRASGQLRVAVGGAGHGDGVTAHNGGGCGVIDVAAPLGWKQWVGDRGDIIAVDRFGASAPGDQVLSHYGFNVDNVVARSEALVQKYR